MERYRQIETDSGINFFDEVGFLRIGIADEQRAKSTVKVRIDVKDDNDNSPIFLPSMH